MYIPKYYQMNDKDEYLDFMRKYSFATIITSKNDKLDATHLPFVVKEENGNIVLYSHFSVANNQYKEISDKTLVIFQEPHSYISPRNYESFLSVPTWNYLAVHAYGKGNIIEGYQGKMDVLAEMIKSYEADYYNDWQKMPDEYKNKMLNGIVAFKIEVNKIQAKKKLSQNKSLKEQENIINYLEKQNNDNDIAIAQYMKAGKQNEIG